MVDRTIASPTSSNCGRLGNLGTQLSREHSHCYLALHITPEARVLSMKLASVIRNTCHVQG